MLGKIVIIEY